MNIDQELALVIEDSLGTWLDSLGYSDMADQVDILEYATELAREILTYQAGVARRSYEAWMQAKRAET